MKGSHKVGRMCKALEVSRSGLDDWSKRDKTPDHQELRVAIHTTFKRLRCNYGHRSIRRELVKQGHHHGRKLILRLMSEEGLRPTASLPKPYGKGKGGEHRVAKNRLKRKFEVKRANRVWTSDITYIWTAFGWVYLAVILDLFSRRIVGWSVSDKPDTTLVKSALSKAIRLRRPRRWRLMFHSDQGCQYTSIDLQQYLRDSGILQSMSRRGQCWDNAPTESFFGTMKQETGIAKFILDDCSAVEIAMLDWIDGWYNQTRRHTTLDGCSPIEFELKMAA
ncbi:MAG: IS3 family transposase [Alphaproteobacteria bacterium]|nr:IS3 family transposase [Alphaproteobacteria bacterium]